MKRDAKQPGFRTSKLAVLEAAGPRPVRVTFDHETGELVFRPLCSRTPVRIPIDRVYERYLAGVAHYEDERSILLREQLRPAPAEHPEFPMAGVGGSR